MAFQQEAVRVSMPASALRASSAPRQAVAAVAAAAAVAAVQAVAAALVVVPELAPLLFEAIVTPLRMGAVNSLEVVPLAAKLALER